MTFIENHFKFKTKTNEKYCKLIFLVSWVLRVGAILVFYYYDNFTDMTLTDIDYRVVSEGAKYVALGQSPFERHTFRFG